MQDADLYQQILGLTEPWSVDQVDLDVAHQRVTVTVAHPAEATWRCPHCDQPAPLYDHGPMRTWRHLDSCQFQTHLQARPPRVDCPQHGVCTVKLPWAQSGSRFTVLMERWIIHVLQQCQNITAACGLLGISWDQASAVMGRAVQRGLARRGEEPVKYLGVDEKRYRRGHVYLTVVSDLDSGAVLEVVDEHCTESLAAFYRALSSAQMQAIEAVAMDMHAPYIKATEQCVPDGRDKIVFDRFHVMSQANGAMERVRVSEYQQSGAADRNILSGARQMLLWARENQPAKYADRFTQLRRQTLRTGRAWAMKEILRRLWEQPTVQAAREFFGRWHRCVRRSKLKPMIRLAHSIQRHLEGVIRYCQHRITTAGCEGINSRIGALQHRAAGYRNFHRLRRAILFYQGQLELYP